MALHIRFTPTQASHNFEHSGGFLGVVLSALVPIIGTAIVSAIGGGVNTPPHRDLLWRTIFGVQPDAQGSGMYLRPFGGSLGVKNMDGAGLYLAPYRGVGGKFKRVTYIDKTGRSQVKLPR